jgi:hypothetical protein
MADGKDVPLSTRADHSRLCPGFGQDEAQIWNLESILGIRKGQRQNYRALWHDNFVGWPFIRRPFERSHHRLDHEQHIKGLNLQSCSIEQLAIRVTGDVAIDHYRIKANWAKGDSGDVFKQTQCGSRTPGSGLTAHGKFSAACQHL